MKSALFVFIALTCISATYAIIDGRQVPVDGVLNSFVHFTLYPQYASNFVCGGILITWRHVLTAKHCAISPEYNLANFGTNLYNDPNALLIAEIEKVEHHRKYHGTHNINPDLSIVTLSGVSRQHMMTLGIRPIDINFDVLPMGSELEVMGFGCHNHYDDPSVGCAVSQELRAATVFKKPNIQCGFQASKDEHKIICLDGTTAGTACGGDSGGPILRRVWSDDGKPQIELVGVMVRVTGKTKCQHRQSIVGVAMHRYRNWLIRRTGPYRRW